MIFEGESLKDYKLDFKDDKLVRVELPNIEGQKSGKWMNEVERVKADLEQSVKNIVSGRAEDEKISLEILSHAAVEIALELALLNDYLKGKTKNEQCESETSISG